MSTELVDYQAALLAVRMRLSEVLTDLNTALLGSWSAESNRVGGGRTRVTRADQVETAAKALNAIIDEMTDDYHEEEED